jgi:nitroimidazol reductase NimA-like FMN-containing flavoprotein (pyridoxamine 5'-phosphate oxidase superfamily)
MTIATVCADGTPWNTPVAKRAHDARYNFYWASDRESVHSRNIRRNNDIFIVMYDSTVPSEKAWGVYVQAKAFELDDAAKVAEIAKRFPDDDPYVPGDAAMYLGDHPRRIFQAVPEKMWMNDESEKDGDYIDIRTEVTFT